MNGSVNAAGNESGNAAMDEAVAEAVDVFGDVHVARGLRTLARHGAVTVSRDRLRILDGRGRTVAEAPRASAAGSPVRTAGGRTLAFAVSLGGTRYYLSPAVRGNERAAAFARDLARAIAEPRAVREAAERAALEAAVLERAAREQAAWDGARPERRRRPRSRPGPWDIAAAVVLFAVGTAFVAAGGAIEALAPVGPGFGVLLGLPAVAGMAVGVRVLGGKPRHAWSVALVGVLLTLVAAGGAQEVVLADRGRWTDTAVVEVDVADPAAGAGHDCVLRHVDDGTRLRHRLLGGACEESTRAGDRIRVVEDPKGFVAPMSDEPDASWEWTVAVVLIAGLAAATALATARGARGARRAG